METSVAFSLCGNSLRPEHVKNIISETIRPISAAIKNLPGMQSMIAALREMQEKVDVLTKKLKKAMSEKEALAKEVAQLREENHAFKQQTAVADKVLFGKLHLSKEAVEKMKAEATSEIFESKSKIQDVRPVSIDDEVLGR